ncbi:DUF4157 domain-containing protein [Streptomyces sp. NPDC058812]|uniref:eCIS core domain-containing protein n=1 Tax=unclassified Streptomyces TaxID=2593676 RepID=UPI0036B51C40
MRAHGTRSRSSDERDPATRQVAAPSAPVQRMLTLQRLAGNAAVARSVEAERHQHGPGCGHAAPTVQRREAPHEHGPGCGHGGVEDTGPTAQRSLLDAARNTPSTSLPGAFLAKAKPFFRNDRLSEGRVHDNPIAQRATAALGAEAMTVGKHIFLGPKADTKTLVHEASHLDKNIKGIPETGNNHGAGLTVTDPGQGSERAADTDSDAFMSGAGTAPSVVAQRSVAEQADGSDMAVQRSTGGGGATVQRVTDLAKQQGPSCWLYVLEAIAQHHGLPIKYLSVAMRAYPSTEDRDDRMRKERAQGNRVDGRRLAVTMMAEGLENMVERLDNWSQHAPNGGTAISRDAVSGLARRALKSDASVDKLDFTNGSAGFAGVREAYSQAHKRARQLVTMIGEPGDEVSELLGGTPLELDRGQEHSDVTTTLKLAKVPSYAGVRSRYPADTRGADVVDLTGEPLSGMRPTTHAVLFDGYDAATDIVTYKDPNAGNARFQVTSTQFQHMSGLSKLTLRGFGTSNKPPRVNELRD